MKAEEKTDVCVTHVTSPFLQSGLLLSWHVLMYIQMSHIQAQGTQGTLRPEGIAQPSLLPSSVSQGLPEYFLKFGGLPTEADNILLGELHNTYVGLSYSDKSTCMLHSLPSCSDSQPLSSWGSGPLTPRLQGKNRTKAQLGQRTQYLLLLWDPRADKQAL